MIKRVLAGILVSFCFFSTAQASSFEEIEDVVISPDFCSLYPITVPAELLTSSQSGQLFSNASLDVETGNYSWLTWQGSTDTNTLEVSLIPPGNSSNYINPDNSYDHQLDIGDWVEGAPGVMNSDLIRARTDALLNRNIIIPVWGDKRLQGANFDYRVARFAIIELNGYRYSGHGYIDFTFKRFTRCYNVRPVALDQTVTTPEDTPLVFNLQANDGDGDPLEYEVLTDPEHGQIEVQDNQVKYTPNPNYNGPDSLEFIVNDGEQLSNTATVSIDVTPVNDPPVAQDQNAEGPEDTPIVLIFVGSDVEESPLTFSPLTQPQHGTIEETADGTTYLPDPDYFGPDSFTYIANDGELDSTPATYTLNIIPVNDPPIAHDIELETESGTPITVALSAEDVDSEQLEFRLLGQPEDGELSGEAPNLTYTSTRYYEGTVSFTYSASDGELESEPATVTIVVVHVNEPPVITNPPQTSTPEQQSYQHQALATDPNDDPLVFELDQGPAGMAIGAGDGSFSWSPQESYVQTVPTFNQQCYVVPSGAAKIFEEGDDVSQAYIAPLFNRVRTAIKNAGVFTAKESIAWHKKNNCLGCHIQTQSLLGLEASKEKAEIDEAAADYLLDEIMKSQLSDGSIRRSHPQYAVNQTAFALWALNQVPERDQTFAVRGKALEFLWSRRKYSGNQLYWTNDHVSGWLRNSDAMISLIVQGAARFIIDSAEREVLTSTQQSMVNNYSSSAPQIADFVLGRASSDGNENLQHAFRLISLAELLPLLSDPERIGRVNAAINYLDTLLRERQEEDGGWNRYASGTVGDPLTSAWVGIALNYQKPAITDPVIISNIEYLLDKQSPASTWVTNSGLFSTHLATTSLVMAYLPVALEHLGNPDVRVGHILLTGEDGGVRKLSAEVSNRGLADVTASVLVSFYNGDPQQADLLGSVELEGITSGQNLSPFINVDDAQVTDDVYVVLSSAASSDECQVGNNASVAALVRVRVSDPEGLFDTQSFTLNVDDVNETPSITSDPVTALQAGQSYKYQVQTSDGDIGDAQQFTLISGPEGLYIDPRTGAFSSAPGALSAGDYQVSVEVEDLRGATTTQTFTLTVYENLPPRITSEPVVRGKERTAYEYQVLASDPNPGDILRYAIEQGPEALQVGLNSGLIEWSSTQSYIDNRTDTNLQCMAEPEVSGDVFQPVLKWHWSGSSSYSSYNQVMASPVVAQLNDDNGDGAINSADVPDVIFSAFAGSSYRNPGMLRALSGADGKEIWPAESRLVTSIHSPAIGDIDHDGLVEIVVSGGYSEGSRKLIVYENDGTLKYQKTVDRIGAPYLADLEGDGEVEIIISGLVFDAFGNEKWRTTRGDSLSVAVDLDLDGVLEVVVGGEARSSTGALLWDVPGSFATVGNFDGDDYPEIALKATGDSIKLMEHDGTVKWGPINIPGGGGGPITIADVDSDGEPEIGIAGGNNYVVFETDGTVKWKNPTRDWSSWRTGSSVFDFEGDGAAEILYSDELKFRVYDGKTGRVQIEIPNPSGTVLEYPLVVDIDNDNHAEIVLVSNNYAFSGTTGIRVFEDINDSWAPTRAIWNQHAYNINNVNDDGTIPAHPAPSWLTHNTYRLNTFADREALALPDLVVHSIEFDEDTNILSAKVKNRGLAPVTKSSTLTFFHEHFWTGDLELGQATVAPLAAGEETTVAIEVDGSVLINDVRVDLTPASDITECVTDNNTTRAAIVDVRVYDPAGLYDTQKYAVSVADDNDLPVITSSASSSASSGGEYSFQVTVEDPDKGDAFVFELLNAPAGVSINPRTGQIGVSDLAEGVYNFTIRATDLSGAVVEQFHVLSVTPPDNLPPDISSQPTVSVVAGERYAYRIEATDPDGDEVVYFFNRSPSGMTIDGVTGEIGWAPTTDQIGLQPVEVVAMDTQGASSRQYFLVEVMDPAANNGVPLISSVPDGNVFAGQLFTYQVVASDPDGDSLSYSLNGAVSGMGISSSGLLSWLPDTALVGQTVIVEVVVGDTHGAYAFQKLTLPVNEAANNPPQITSTPPQQAVEEQEYLYTVEVQDTDGDAVQLSLDQAPNGMVISGSAISWVPSTAQADQVHTVVVRATDARGAASLQTYGIAVNHPDLANSIPQIKSIPQSPAIVDQDYLYTVIAHDADGDSLTYTLVSGPDSMTLSAQGVLQWRPTTSQLGLHRVELRVSDGKDFALQTFTLDAVSADGNHYPEITNYPPGMAVAGYSYTHQIVATDADGDLLTFGTMAQPEGMTVSASGEVQWTPRGDQVGSHEVTLFADDGQGRTLQTYWVDVSDELKPLAVTINVSPEYPNEGDTVTIDLFTEGGLGQSSASMMVDGQPIALDQFGQTQVTAVGAGLHEIEITVTEGDTQVIETASFSVQDPLDTEAPQVSVISPDFDARITAPVDVIATVQDANLTGYQVYISPKEAGQWQLIGEGGSSITEGVVATFDPSLLVNGQYDIIVQAKDTNGLTTSDGVSVLVDGDLKVGNFSITFEDLNIPMAGIPIRVTRTYDSRRRFEPLDFGYGWSVGYQDVKVDESKTPGKFWEINQYNRGPLNLIADFCIEPQGAPIVSVTLPSGDVERFEASASPRCSTYQVIKDVSLVFNAVGDTQSKLEALDDVSARYENGTLWEKGTFSEPVNPTRYKLTTRNGYVYILHQDNGIEQVIDPNGHTLTYTNDGIFHSSGKAVRFTRDSRGRITRITDPKGQVLNYRYDADANLAGAQDPESNDTSFTYNRNHGLLDIVDPLGRTVVRNIYDNDGRLIAQEDSDGNRTEFSHDLDGRQSVVTDRLGRTSILYYDDEGNVTAKVDPLGNTTSYTYDQRGNQLSQIDPLGNQTLATYNDSNDQLTATDGEGNTISYSHNTRGQELTITDAVGNRYVNAYDSVGNLLSVTDPDGKIAGNNIDADGQVILIQDALGNRTTYTYDGDGNKLTETDALGQVTRYTYDANGNVLTETRPRTRADGTTVDEITRYAYDSQNRVIETTLPDGSVQSSEYDAIGNQTAIVDAQGRRTEYEYDVYGRVLQTRYPDGTLAAGSYDAEGNKLTDTDRLGRVTRYTYDALNRLIGTTYPDGSITSSEYDATGRVTAEVDPRGNRAEYGYDRAGRRTWVRDALGNEHRFAYDANGNLIEETDALGRVTRYSYNALDQRTRTTYDDSSALSDTQDALGRRTARTDQAGIVTEYAYDALGRLTSVTDALGGITSYAYDEAGNKISQTDAEGRITRWEYDNQGRVTARILPLGQRERFAYDTNGNRVEHTDFNGDTTYYSYDSSDRVVRIDYADGRVDTYTYDDAGNRLSASNGQGAWNYSHDQRNRLSRVTQQDGSELRYGYDAAGNRTSLQVLGADGTALITQTFVYDALNRLQSLSDDQGTTSYGYDEVGNRSSVSYANGTSTTYAYDRLNRLIRLGHYAPNGALLNEYSYTLDATGRRTGILETDGRDTRYGYDTLYRLVSERIDDPSAGTSYSADYQYDAVGNRTYSTIDGVQAAYSYDANDRLLQQGGIYYSYDANGNALSQSGEGDTLSYSYDVRNQMIAVDSNGVTTEYAYDPDGIRLRKAEVGGNTTDYLVDANRDYAQVLVESTDTARTLYSYGDDLISQERNGVASYFHYDGLGSTRILTDASGNQTDSYDYEAFGELLSQTGTTENSYRYTGEQYDQTLDQYYLRARYYDPGQGRFTQMDTWMGGDNDPITLHKYLYANADPVTYSDPSGKFSLVGQMQTISIAAILSTAAVQAPKFASILDTSIDAPLSPSAVGLLMIMGTDPIMGAKLANLIGAKTDAQSETAAENLVPLYRAVENAEYVSIVSCRCFSFPDYGYGIEPTSVKRFFLAPQSAITFGNLFFKGGTTFHLLEANVSARFYASLPPEPPGDAFIGPGIAVPFGLIPALNAEVMRNGGINYLGSY